MCEDHSFNVNLFEIFTHTHTHTRAHTQEVRIRIVQPPRGASWVMLIPTVV